MIPMLYLKYNKSAAYRFYQEQTCRDRFSHTYNSSFYICNTETTIKKSRQTHFANNKHTILLSIFAIQKLLSKKVDKHTLQIIRKQVSYAHNWKSAPAIMQPHICR
jgi:hypothetical protein